MENDNRQRIKQDDLSQNLLRDLILSLEKQIQTSESAEELLETLWRVLALAPPTEASKILITLYENEWKPNEKYPEYEQLISMAEKLRFFEPPFKSRLKTPFSLEGKGNQDIIAFAVDASWRYLATIRELPNQMIEIGERGNSNHSIRTKKDNHDLLEIWQLPDGDGLARIKIPKLFLTNSRYPSPKCFTSIDLRVWVIADDVKTVLFRISGELCDAPDITIQQLPATNARQFAVSETQNEIYILTNEQQVLVCDFKTGATTSKMELKNFLNDGELYEKLCFSEVDQVFFLGTNTGRILKIGYPNNNLLKAVHCIGKGGFDTFQLIDNGKKLAAACKDLIRIMDTRDLSIHADLTDTDSSGVTKQEHSNHETDVLPSSQKRDGVLKEAFTVNGMTAMISDADEQHGSSLQISSRNNPFLRLTGISRIDQISADWDTLQIVSENRLSVYDFHIEYNSGSRKSWTELLRKISSWFGCTISITADGKFSLIYAKTLDVTDNSDGSQVIWNTTKLPDLSFEDYMHLSDELEKPDLEFFTLFYPQQLGRIYKPVGVKRIKEQIDEDASLLDAFQGEGKYDQVKILQQRIDNNKGKLALLIQNRKRLHDILLSKAVFPILKISSDSQQMIVHHPESQFILSLAMTNKDVSGDFLIQEKLPSEQLKKSTEVNHKQPDFPAVPTGNGYLGFTRCFGSNNPENLIVTGHITCVRVWNIKERRLVWYLPLHDRGITSGVQQISMTPTGYHFLCLQARRLFLLDPRSYLLSGTPVKFLTDEDIYWLDLLHQEGVAREWVDFIKGLHTFLKGMGKAISFPDNLYYEIEMDKRKREKKVFTLDRTSNVDTGEPQNHEKE